MNPIYHNHTPDQRNEITKRLATLGVNRPSSAILSHIGNYPSTYQEQASTLKAAQPAFLSGTWLVRDPASTGHIMVPAVGPFGTGTGTDVIEGLSGPGAVDNTTYPSTYRPAIFEPKEGTVYSFRIKDFVPGVTPVPVDFDTTIIGNTFAAEQLATAFDGVMQVLDLSAPVPTAQFAVKDIAWNIGYAFVVLLD